MKRSSFRSLRSLSGQSDGKTQGMKMRIVYYDNPYDEHCFPNFSAYAIVQRNMVVKFTK